MPSIRMGYTVRVYGLLINDNKDVLLCREKIGDFEFVKFPGGGLEAGEGIKEALLREFAEETGISIEIERLVYVTDFYVESRFLPGSQVIAAYYTVKALKIAPTKPIQESDFHHQHTLSLFWKNIKTLSVGDLSFESDKKAWEALLVVRMAGVS